MEFPGFIVAGGIRSRCEAGLDASPKPFVRKITETSRGLSLGEVVDEPDQNYFFSCSLFPPAIYEEFQWATDTVRSKVFETARGEGRFAGTSIEKRPCWNGLWSKFVLVPAISAAILRRRTFLTP